MALVGILGSLECIKYTKLYSLTTMNDKYKTYLLSDEWKQKRELVFQKKWRACEKCKSENNLRIHHWTYIRIYKEKVSDLFVLCNDCHWEFHKLYWTRDILRATKAWILWIEVKQRIRMTLEERRAARKERNAIKLEIAIQAIKNWITFKESNIGSIKIWKQAKKLFRVKAK